MTFSRVIATLVATVALSGCGTFPNRASVQMVPAAEFSSARNGVILLSMGAPEYCISTSTMLQIFDMETTKVVQAAPLMFVDAYTIKSEFPFHYGTVNGASLPPGRYYFEPKIANPYVVSNRVPRFSFEVVPGQTSYLGEIFMTRSCALKTTFVVRDEYNRDLQIAVEKNPAVTTRPIVKRLMKPFYP
jgi:hypothetical protein